MCKWKRLISLSLISFMWRKKDAIIKIIQNNRDLDWWFEDIKNTAVELIEDGRKCAISSGIRQESVSICVEFKLPSIYYRLWFKCGISSIFPAHYRWCLLKWKGKSEKQVSRIIADLPEVIVKIHFWIVFLKFYWFIFQCLYSYARRIRNN